jgi:hypothetical protein
MEKKPWGAIAQPIAPRGRTKEAEYAALFRYALKKYPKVDGHLATPIWAATTVIVRRNFKGCETISLHLRKS